MANVLFLAHRLPYPPNKGDKVRSYHLLHYLAARHDVYLGTFFDDPDDEQHVPHVRELCADLHVERLKPRLARVRSLSGLARDEPLSLSYYRSAKLRQWCRALKARRVIDGTLVFSSAMAQYADQPQGRMLVDFVAVDSAKWAAHAGEHRWPLSWLYGREGRKLFAYERSVARAADRSVFSTEQEARLFCSRAPECSGRVGALSNGVDFDYFESHVATPSPYRPGEAPIVFTGAMDYWPNVDAVTWFVQAMLPPLCKQHPGLRFHIVGRNPSAAVLALAGAEVSVTGTVPDVRPYLQHAAVVVAPLRLARGIQYKVLEAMAMGRPVVAAASCVQAIDAIDGLHLIGAEAADDYVHAVSALLRAPDRAAAIGRAGMGQVRAVYGWDARLAGLEGLLGLPADAEVPA